MKLNNYQVIIKPKERETNSFDQEIASHYRGVVEYVADNVFFVEPGDEVIFFTIKPFISEENWWVVDESEILVNLSKEV